MITPLDPIFMFIPILEIVRQQTSGSAGRFMVVDDIFESDQYTSLRHLAQLHNIEKLLAQICEVRGNWEKATSWKSQCCRGKDATYNTNSLLTFLQLLYIITPQRWITQDFQDG